MDLYVLNERRFVGWVTMGRVSNRNLTDTARTVNRRRCCCSTRQRIRLLGIQYSILGCGPTNVGRVLGVSESKSESETVDCTGISWCASFAVVRCSRGM